MRAVAAAVVLGLASACVVPVRAVGVVRPVEGGWALSSTQGRSAPLLLPGDARLLQTLDGELVEVEGLNRRGAIEVTSFRVAEGRHGLSAWIGRLGSTPDGLVVQDLDSGVPLRLSDPDGALYDAVGEVVLVEGFVNGPLGVSVYDWRVLRPTEAAVAPGGPAVDAPSPSR